MENKLSFAVFDDDRSLDTEGENKSRRSSILKPPKARAPLQEVNLGGAPDDTEEFDTLRKRRVSFAGVNSVKEFCSNAESAHVGNIPSYEETFSMSCDGSHNSTEGKSLQDTPKFATSSALVDKNFVDDPMELTDSAIENNIHQVDPPAVTEKPFHGRGMIPVANLVSSCSMEMTEPVQKIRFLTTDQQPSSDRRLPRKPSRNSIKPIDVGLSDSGMELTEAISNGFGAFQLHPVDGNAGNTSMEMTEVIQRDKTSNTPLLRLVRNKSAESSDFIGVIRNEANFVNALSQNADVTKTGSQESYSGMEITHLKTKPSFGQSVQPDDKENSRPFFHSVADDSVVQGQDNQSLCEMEMTGVLSLSKYDRQGFRVDQMDFTHQSPSKPPAHKHARLSVDADESPLPFPSRFPESEPLIVDGIESTKESVETGDRLVDNVEKKVEEDEDTISLNFNRKPSSPVELSFLKEFSNSPEATVAQCSKMSEMPRTEKKEAPNDDHILLFSMSRVLDCANKEFPPAENVISRKESILPTDDVNGLQQKSDLMAANSFQLGTSGTQPKEARLDVLRESRKSQIEDPLPLRVSFKDLEIKADNVGIDESLSAVGLDDSSILKADFDLTRQEVPRVSSMYINSTIMASPKDVSTLADKRGVMSSAIVDEETNIKSASQFDHDIMTECKSMPFSVADPEHGTRSIVETTLQKSSSDANVAAHTHGVYSVPESQGSVVRSDIEAKHTMKVARPRRSIFPVSTFYSSRSISSSQQMELTEVGALKKTEGIQSVGEDRSSPVDSDMELSLMDQSSKIEKIRSENVLNYTKSIYVNDTLQATGFADQKLMVPEVPPTPVCLSGIDLMTSLAHVPQNRKQDMTENNLPHETATEVSTVLDTESPQKPLVCQEIANDDGLVGLGDGNLATAMARELVVERPKQQQSATANTPGPQQNMAENNSSQLLSTEDSFVSNSESLQRPLGHDTVANDVELEGHCDENVDQVTAPSHFKSLQSDIGVPNIKGGVVITPEGASQIVRNGDELGRLDDIEDVRADRATRICPRKSVQLLLSHENSNEQLEELGPVVSPQHRYEGASKMECSAKPNVYLDTDEGVVSCQDMMDISIEKDMKSPMPKKHKSSLRNVLVEDNRLQAGVTFGRSYSGSNAVQKKVTSREAYPGDLPYEVRLKNCNFMKSRNFKLQVANTYQILLFQSVLGLEVVVPPCEISENTTILNVYYTFYPHKLGRTCFLHREIVDLFKRRLFLNHPEQWIKGECRTVRDLDRIVSCLKEEISSSKPLISRLSHVMMTDNCQIIDDRLHFTIINTDLSTKFDASVPLPSSHLTTDSEVVIANASSEIDVSMVQFIYRSLSPSVDMYSIFIDGLTRNVAKILV